MIKITLCPNCCTIQKAGTTCSICKYPIPEREASPLSGCKSVTPQGGIAYKAMPGYKVEAIIRLRKRGLI